MLFSYLRKAALKLVNSRGPDFAIGSSKPPGIPYMLRWWWLPRNPFFNIYVHRFLENHVDRDLHDHPWASLSILLEGSILEMYLTQFSNGAEYTASRVVKTGDYVYRPASFAHRIVILPKGQELPLTIVITGPRIREWGFHCIDGWRHWKEYTHVSNGKQRRCKPIEIGDTIHCRSCGKPTKHVISYFTHCNRCMWWGRPIRATAITITSIAVLILYAAFFGAIQ